MRPLHPARGYRTEDTAHSPLLVFYECTKACDLACSHCRACAMPHRHPNELDTETARRLLDDLAGFPARPTVVFTGGDPLKRGDLPDLVEHAHQRGLRPALAPAATELLTDEAIDRLADRGLASLAVSIDGDDEAVQTELRGVAGTLRRAVDALMHAQARGLRTQVNTSLHTGNADRLDRIAELIHRLAPDTWSVFFVVPVGRGRQTARLAPEQYREAFDTLAEWSTRTTMRIKTTAAPFYRRYRFESERNRRPERRPARPLGINDGQGVCFVSHTGQIQPSGFLPMTCGRFPTHSVVDVYQHHPRFIELRDPDRLKGKCRGCEARSFCGGSRARAYAVTQDPHAAEPDCPFAPLRRLKLPVGDDRPATPLG